MRKDVSGAYTNAWIFCPYQSLKLHSLVIHWHFLQNPMILKAEREGPDQTAQMHSLIRAFAVRICPEGIFSHGVAVDIGLLQYLY